MDRRTFLKLGAALGAAAHLSLASPLLIASTLPVSFAHQFFPNAESLLQRRLAVFDLLLVPAYAAAELIRRGALQSLTGPPGRAHDPDGAFTIPFTAAVCALLYHGPSPASLDDLWTQDALWPDASRLVIGAALLRRGHPLNDAHPGHLALVEEDLVRLSPRIVSDPVAGLRLGLSALALAPRLMTQADLGAFLPPEGAPIIEYDWVIPLGASHTEAARKFIAEHTLSHTSGGTPLGGRPRLIPLTPLPAAALAQRAKIWSRVKRAARQRWHNL